MSKGCRTKTMTFGRMPAEANWDQNWRRCGPAWKYHLSLGATDSRAADGTRLGDGSYSSEQLRLGVKELVAKCRRSKKFPDAPACDLASSILSTLGYEWI